MEDNCITLVSGLNGLITVRLLDPVPGTKFKIPFLYLLQTAEVPTTG